MLARLVFRVCAAATAAGAQGQGQTQGGTLLVNARMPAPERLGMRQVRLSCRLGFGYSSFTQKRLELVCPGTVPTLP